ncbi:MULTISPECIES: peptidoglycan editing factor PgeF [unclassified Corallococcus]|uniref:peptidoglycan editing factor PgeF n=1 Tax=unclassified Corallococcus TaxID=2685029 RepID=UPI001A90A387|nr:MULTISPECIES: peptidoglycan editing factor PgeF [unclassified Corallococcus]MBN9684292.1 peptidoglycan editing factor PgeF [Corallococcus sp. NCSPR001]WAS84226.1 peptidoglycan editing factor PgeF [Corallococcus sp. NCRR]
MATPQFLTSALLPVPHGFATRAGGVSEGPYASLNLGFSVGDERPRVEENHRRLARAAGAQVGALCRVSQVHGDTVLEARGEADDVLRPTLGEADALWTQGEGSWVAVGTADCVPVLIVDPREKRVAAVHSGWKGTDLEISARTVEALVARGSRPEDLLAAVGPCIQACCYEVSPELGDRFRARFGPDVVRAGGKPHLDLSLAVKSSLLKAGLKPAHVDVLQACTACDPDRFFSHRRDAGRTGRHLNYVLHRF